MDEIDHRKKEPAVRKWIALLIFLMLAPGCAALADAPAPVLPEGDLRVMDVSLRPDTAWTVYAGPGADDPAANEGKARVSANSWVQVLGGEGWGRILVQYAVNDQRLRIGWIDVDALAPEDHTYVVCCEPGEKLLWRPCHINSDCSLTDDPLLSKSVMANLKAGTQVTYLTTCANQRGELWDYVETRIDGKTARGFVPHGYLIQAADQLPDIDYDLTNG